MSVAPTGLREALREFRKRRLNVAAGALVVALALVAISAELIASDLPLLLRLDGRTFVLPNLTEPAELRHHDAASLLEALGPEDWLVPTPLGRGPSSIDLTARLTPPSAAHPLGTDGVGRDVAARLVHGARISLAVGFVAVSLYVLIGLFFGALAGFYGGVVDLIVTRLLEVMLVFPTFFLVLTVMGIVEHTSIWLVMGVIGLTGWPGVARLVRGELLRLRGLDFVLASRALGASDARLLLRHLLPNALGPVFVAATFGVAGAILTESALAFLGFGTPPPAASWGELLTQAYDYAVSPGAWWLTLFPGLAIFLTVTAFNLVGEGLRDALDPRLRR